MRILARALTAAVPPGLPVTSAAPSGGDPAELQRLKERLDALAVQMKEQAVSPPVGTPDHSAKLLEMQRRLEILESRPPSVASEPDAPALKRAIEPLLDDALKEIRTALRGLTERVQSCEQAPRRLTETVIKEVESRLTMRLVAFEKETTQRLEQFSILVKPTPEPSPVPPVTAPAPDWNSRFEHHERVLSGLMEEISTAAMVAKALPQELVTECNKTAPPQAEQDDALKTPEIEASIFLPEASPNEPTEDFSAYSPSQKSVIGRFWDYLNAPAFGPPPHPPENPFTHQ